jgi:hypothetical protein
LEWKQGGLSDVTYYIIKYRIENDMLVDDYQYSNNIDTNDEYQPMRMANEIEFYYYENTTNTKYRIQNRLKPFKFYTFQVIAVNEVGDSDASESLRVQTAASSMPVFHDVSV